MSETAMAPGMTVLTGGSGWFGRCYLATLTKTAISDAYAHQVRVLVQHPAQQDVVRRVAPHARVVVGDVADPVVLRELMDGAAGAQVVHAAGVIHPRRYADFEHVNVQGTRAVLAAARAAGIARLVYLSSNAPFGRNSYPEDTFRHEEPYRPYLGYGASKMRAEIAVRQAHDASGLETVVLRPPWFYGEEQPMRQTRFLTLCRRGHFPLISDGHTRRSMVYIGNLVDAVQLAQQHRKAAGGAYWVADARPYTLAEIIITVRQALREEGYPVSPYQFRIPRVAATLAGRADRALQATGCYHPQIHMLGELNHTIACDISQTTADLAYQPRVALLEGMRRAIRWCRTHYVNL
ncbi:NAD-dependent epimerase/dehydratase family protein [Streptomyces chartreusis]|uniref:NAD-dependent epimerase/dehydratase family protein n=1 Tax=Streptomyces chartreusis TaxID=1969 RepID=UPI0037FC84AD